MRVLLWVKSKIWGFLDNCMSDPYRKSPLCPDGYECSPGYSWIDKFGIDVSRHIGYVEKFTRFLYLPLPRLFWRKQPKHKPMIF